MHLNQLFILWAFFSGLCSWVINIIKYYEIFVVVEPKRQALMKANRDLQEARDKLKFLKDKLSVSTENIFLMQN